MEKYPEKVLCAECRNLQSYAFSVEKVQRVWNGVECSFNKRVAICNKCGNRVMVPGLEDYNEREFDIKFREENDYILVEEIRDVLTKYDVEKRPLSRVLGWGEHTIENYLKGQLPNRRYSAMLRRLLVSYEYMQRFYDENRNCLNDHAAKRIGAKLDYYRSINSHDSAIETIALYVLNSKYEITNMSLQKLLYYIEAFCQILLQVRIFDNRCEAWMYGPVYPEIYDKYKSFGSALIQVDEIDLSGELDERYRKVIDFVLNQFAIYNGVTLKDFSHAEDPWKKAHAGYGQKERCEEVITHEEITEYFTRMHDIFDLSTELGVRKYIESLGVI
ncbi:MAG: DUF4065 domain-containing protein [Lachnospiraceae bacterium]|nr:DUF4065 domain-containing protein [Lachnospiraceae bacterium]